MILKGVAKATPFVECENVIKTGGKNVLDKLHKKKAYLILFIILLEVIVLFFNIRKFDREWQLEVSREELLTYDNENGYISGFYADHSYAQNMYITTDAIFLEKGLYEVTVDYESNSDGNWRTCYTTMVAEADNTEEQTANLVLSDKVALPSENKSTSFTTWVRYGENYRVTLGPERDESGDNIYVLGQKVTITYLKNSTILREVSKLIFVFILINLGIYCRVYEWERVKNYLKNQDEFVIGGILFVIIFTSFPLLYRMIYFGDDIFYHLRRISYLADGLKAGYFPVKIQPGWDNGYGYAVGVCYGDLLLYPSAILVLLGNPLQFAYKFYIFFINILTALISYYSYKKIADNKYIGLVCSILYSLMGFRLHSIYAGATVGEFGAYTFLPLVILGLYEIYQKKASKAYITLSLGITLTLSSHVLSTLILAMVIPVFALIFIEKTIQKEVFLSLLKALGLTILLNLYFVIPCAEYLIFQDMVGNKNFDTLWVNGQELVNLFINMDDPSLNSGGWSGLGFYSLIIVSFAAAFIVSGKFKDKTHLHARLFLMTLGLTFLSTNSILYFWLKYNMNILYKLLGNLQFPWHFLNVVSGLLIFYMAKILEEIKNSGKKKNIGYILSSAVVILCIVQSGMFLREVIVEGNPITMYDDAKLKGINSVEFAINNIDKSLTYNSDVVVNDDFATVNIVKRKGITLNLQAQNLGERKSVVEIPLWGYRHYTAKSKGEVLEIVVLDNKKLGVVLPPGFDSEVKVYFKEPWYWRIAELLSLSGVVWIVAKVYWTKREKRIENR